MKWFPAILFFLVFSTGLAGAGDEVSINEQLKAGGNVHLQEGIYNIEGPIYIHSNTVFSGEPDTILRVSATSGMWFSSGSEGIITCKESVKNVEIHGFQIDGNCRKSPCELRKYSQDMLMI